MICISLPDVWSRLLVLPDSESPFGVPAGTPAAAILV